MFRNLLLVLILIILTCGIIAAHNSDIEDRNGFDTAFPMLERSFVETPPPAGPVRPVGEFEPASHVLIRYPLGIPLSLVVHLSNASQVVCLVGSSTTQSQAVSAFQSAGVNMANVSFLIAATNSYWTRDFGPWFVIDGNNTLGVVDFPYNRPRPLDDEIPRTFAQTFDYPLFGMNVIQTGGNYMTDGINTVAQTTLVYDENPSLSQQQIHQKMSDYMGAVNYYVVNDPNNTYIDHIDCWGKFLAPDKILIRSVPTSHAQYNAIEAVANYFAGLNSAWGYPYRVFRVNTPQNQPYTNSLILNNNVYVPIMNSTYDAAALQAYRDALPGFNVVGITGASSTPWESTDALHCRTHEIPDKEMLYIHHIPYYGTAPLQDFYDFNAYIYPHSNQPVYSDSLLVVYRVNSGQWQNAVLTNVSGSNYTTMVSGLTPGDTIRYFIHAADQSGHSVNHPLTGPDDPHVFRLTPDNVPPVITHNPITVVEEDQLPITLLAQVTDNYGVGNVQAVYRFDDGTETTVEMESSIGDFWMAIFSPQIPQNAAYFQYRIAAYDNSNPANVSYSPAQGWHVAEVHTTSNSDSVIPAIATSLDMIYPNPFRTGGSANLTIAYTAKANRQVKFDLYNVKGQLLKSFDAVTRTSGNQYLTLSAANLAGLNLTNGIYYLRMVTPDRTETAKLLILK